MFRIKAQCFEALLMNIITEYEEELLRENKLKILKKYRIFKAFQAELLKNSVFKENPVLSGLSDMLVEVRNMNMKEKVFKALKTFKNIDNKEFN